AAIGGTGWLNFRRITNRRWDHGNVVLMGDAAHTTHFAIGSGTKLAIQDAMALADAVGTGDGRTGALARDGHRRRRSMSPLQRRAALASRKWFETMPDCAALPANQFSYALSNRRGESPTWRYVLHLSTQRQVPRAVLRWTLSTRRRLRARRRATETYSRPTLT